MFNLKDSIKIANLLRKSNARLLYLNKISKVFFQTYYSISSEIGEGFDWSDERFEPLYKQTHVFISTYDTMIMDEKFLIWMTGYDPNVD